VTQNTSHCRPYS